MKFELCPVRVEELKQYKLDMQEASGHEDMGDLHAVFRKEEYSFLCERLRLSYYGVFQ